MKILILSLIISMNFIAQSQDRLEKGKYISSDKLKYLTIENDSIFRYNSYLYYSPYTVEEKRKKEANSAACGSIGYWVDLQGDGKYKILNGRILLDFEIDFFNISQRNTVFDFRLVRGITLDINNFEKLE